MILKEKKKSGKRKVYSDLILKYVRSRKSVKTTQFITSVSNTDKNVHTETAVHQTSPTYEFLNNKEKVRSK